MKVNTRLGINDYLKKAGLNRGMAQGRQEPSGANGDPINGFSRVLTRLQSPARAPAQDSKVRLQIDDYRQRPIPARSSAHVSAPLAKTNAKEPSLVADGPWLLADTTPVLTPPFAISTPLDVSIAAPEPPPTEQPVAQRIAAGIQAAAAKYDLPPALIRGVIRAESDFQPAAVSPAGAQGLMQLMPATAEELGVENPFDIEQNIDGGARYLRQMLDLFGGDLGRALAAYNAGPGTVMRYNGQVPYAETRRYVQKVLALVHQPSRRSNPNAV